MSQYFLFKNTKKCFGFSFAHAYPEVVPLMLMLWQMLLLVGLQLLMLILLLVGLKFWLLEVRAECC